MKYFVGFVCSVAMLVASVAQSAVIVNITEGASPGAGFQSWIVNLSGTDGSLVGGIANLNVTGAHQVWENAAGNGDTPRQGDTNGTFGNPEWAKYDTYLLNPPASGINESPGLTRTETNDGTNPGGISLLPGNPAFPTFLGTAGFGSLALGGASPTIAFLAPNPQSVDILQIVTYGAAAGAEGTALLSLDVFDAAANREHVERIIGGGPVIPEPSTFALAGLALVGLVGYTRRRK